VTMLQEGIYVLTRDITNPRPDRRTRGKAWLKVDEWEKGMRFSIRRAHWLEKDLSESGSLRDRRCFELRYLGERYAGYVNVFEQGGIVEHVRGNFPEDAEQAMIVLVSALARSTERDDELEWIFLDRGTTMGHCAEDILHRLICHGKVTLDDVRAMMVESDVEDEEAQRKEDVEREAAKAAKEQEKTDPPDGGP